jgi:predicted DNA-binding transcriptional regulator AlpA
MAKITDINWCSEQEAMKLLGYKKEGLRKAVRKEKTIPVRSVKTNYRNILYSKSDIERWIMREYESQNINPI